MNKKTEDQLVRLAFGDLTPEEATRLQAEAESHPDSARALDTYRRMKSELRSLADVPEDQLSKERLREAILTRGLQERPVKRSWSWLWMPTAAAAVAFGITFAKGHFIRPDAPLTASVLDSSVVKEPGDLGKINPFSAKPHQPSLDSVVPPEGTFEDETSNATVAMTDTPRRGSNMSRSRHGGREDSDVKEFLKDWADSMTAPKASNPEASGPQFDHVGGATPTVTGLRDPKDTMPPAGPAGETVMSASKPPIILIQPEKDSSTGARKATEVESASNVLVGG